MRRAAQRRDDHARGGSRPPHRAWLRQVAADRSGRAHRRGAADHRRQVRQEAAATAIPAMRRAALAVLLLLCGMLPLTAHATGGAGSFDWYSYTNASGTRTYKVYVPPSYD